MDLTAGNQCPICTAIFSEVATWVGRRDSRIYSVQGRTGVSPVPLGRQPEWANSKIPAVSLFSDVRRHRSIQRNQLPAGQAGRLPYFANRLAASIIKARSRWR